MKIYCVSGLGANHNVFKHLRINSEFELVAIPWLIPEKKETLEHYVHRMMKTINPNEEFMLLGLSFGGIVIQEMNKHLNPKHNFLLSTVKSRREMPPRFKLTANTKIYKALPTIFFTNDSVISYAFFRKFYDSKMPSLDEFFSHRDSTYLNWSIHNVLQWKETNPIENYTHIHGDKDIVFPIKNIQNTVPIKGGTHIMVMQKPREVTKAINEKLIQF